MKSDSDNFRDAAIHDVIKIIRGKKKEILIYEPALKASDYDGVKVTSNLKQFKKECSIIVANRMTPELEDVREKVYTRDLFSRD